VKPFFSTPERLGRLELEAARWVGTPFSPHAAVCGAGVDCVNLAAQLLSACGHATEFLMPKYVMDGGKHNRTSQLTDYLNARKDFGQVLEPEPEPGDVLCFKLGRSSHHCGLMLAGKRFIHALYGRKVAIASLSDRTFARSLSAIYRPVEVSR
jgi:hypothetical protein